MPDSGMGHPPHPDRRKQSLGRRGENIASAYLQDRGYTVVARNWRCPVGEMDIVAYDDECLVFVEVRARRGTMYGSPEESITPHKQAKLVEVAHTYLQATGQENSVWRVDVIAIQLGTNGEVLRLNHICNAVEEQ